MLQPIEQNKDTVKKPLIGAPFFFIPFIFCKLMNYKVKRYIFGFCPKGSMAAIGKYRRNLIDFRENLNFIDFWTVWVVWLLAIRIGFVIYPDRTPRQVFYTHHGTYLLFVWFFHGLVLPLSMKIPWKYPRKETVSSFYVIETFHFPLMHSPAPPHSSPTLKSHQHQALHSKIESSQSDNSTTVFTLTQTETNPIQSFSPESQASLPSPTGSASFILNPFIPLTQLSEDSDFHASLFCSNSTQSNRQQKTGSQDNNGEWGQEKEQDHKEIISLTHSSSPQIQSPALTSPQSQMSLSPLTMNQKNKTAKTPILDLPEAENPLATQASPATPSPKRAKTPKSPPTPSCPPSGQFWSRFNY